MDDIKLGRKVMYRPSLCLKYLMLLRDISYFID